MAAAEIVGKANPRKKVAAGDRVTGEGRGAFWWLERSRRLRERGSTRFSKGAEKKKEGEQMRYWRGCRESERGFPWSFEKDF